MKPFFLSAFDKIKQRSSRKKQRGFLLNPARFAAGGVADTGDEHWASVVGYYRFNDAAGATQVVDESWAARHLSRSGTAATVSAGALRGGGSASIPASGNSAFFVTNSEEQNISTGDFTIELLYRNTATPQEFARLFQTRDGDTFGGISILASGSAGVRQFQLYLSGNGTSFGIANGVGVTNYSIDTTYHIALTRQGDTFRFFINGALVATITNASSIYYSTSDRTIIGGNSTSTSRSVGGLIDEVRITKGIARYTAAFTPPAAEFVNRGIIDSSRNLVSAHLSMLGRNDSTVFYDLAPRRKQPVANGNAKISTAVSKYGGSAGLFDGTGDYASYGTDNADYELGTQDFCFESWAYVTNLSASRTIVGRGQTGTNAYELYVFTNGAVYGNCYLTGATVSINSAAGAITLNTWVHVAFTRAAGVFRLFVNGVLVAGPVTNTNSAVSVVANLEVGRLGVSTTFDFAGYLDDFRFTKGDARYTANFTPPTKQLSISGPADTSYSSVVSLVKFEGPDGVTPILDSTGKRIWTNNGLSLTPTNRRFGRTCAATVGGQWASTPASADFNFGTGDFIIEGWVRTTSTNARQAFIGQMDSGTTDASFQIEITSGFFRAYAFTTGGTTVLYNITGATAVALNTWYHVAVTREGTTIRLFVNGVLDATATGISGAMHSSSSNLSIGRSGDYTLLTFVGQLDNFRINKGVARYTSAFTPPGDFPAYGA